eukprot:CAMPEP_0204123600 /NCGR_PEP_ID=MMETSP0361-20130328/9390_1 /ASSEMBLY_ACC=CAM_ASM_000343 /TAXON_ID=268821 /ORGANISM="Scrippsiella Hangoei, Strain SHTV-5" /LENGTH=149 /DNA_ID=CAMNT_0051075087 /DNA_START=159 /DNA_END=605 /DNA_ORIENTATION=+
MHDILAVAAIASAILQGAVATIACRVSMFQVALQKVPTQHIWPMVKFYDSLMLPIKASWIFAFTSSGVTLCSPGPAAAAAFASSEKIWPNLSKACARRIRICHGTDLSCKNFLETFFTVVSMSLTTQYHAVFIHVGRALSNAASMALDC